MSVVGGILSPMDPIIFLIVGALLGVAAGFFIGKGRAASVPLPVDNNLESALADARARVELLTKQVDQLEAQRVSREAKDAQENKLLIELAPVKDNLAKMQAAVQQMEDNRLKQNTELHAALKQTLESDELLRKQTDSLAAALGNNTVRGLWGEAQLRRLVELAGLLKHADFDEQATITTGRADMIINLPGGKQLAIDSKVPYNSYQEASKISVLAEGAEKARREVLLKEHVKAMKSHIDTLATKAYWTSLNASPDFVVCFIPSESLLAASLEADPTILEYAFQKNVALASPVSLFSVLKTINFIWRQNVDETQVRNMIRLGHELYERVGKIAALADKLGRSILGSVNDYNSFISSFEGRFLVTARKLNDLDENELSTSTIDTPKLIGESPKQITASELNAEEKPE
jgi:DNA recombination protein RmuC